MDLKGQISTVYAAWIQVGEFAHCHTVDLKNDGFVSHQHLVVCGKIRLRPDQWFTLGPTGQWTRNTSQ